MHPGPDDLMRVGDGGGYQLGERGRHQQVLHSQILYRLAGSAGKCGLEVLVNRELDGDVGDADESRPQPRVHSSQPLLPHQPLGA
eukprot:CAMPEP_0196590404 /NCGR_PEP_ID=MMETSP1081-20130531/66556_1 /TAXON_ID=36882 /ORGANISM="Pyramimonas amylifera, Strain CCMP720" /LENGTH=84 /DNA_ID=CAMNT_0041913505 /DNA_START=291 /DNA_END=541 /DNA_ORIENTATION=+